MTDAQQISPGRTSGATRRRRVWWVLLVGGIFAALMSARLIWGHITWSDFIAARAEAQASGLLVEADDLIPLPCPDEENAALVYQEAFALITKVDAPYGPGTKKVTLRPELASLTGRAFSKDWGTWDARERAQALAILDAAPMDRVWSLLARGAQMPRCRFTYQYEDKLAMLMPELGLMISLRKLGTVRIRLLLETGRVAEAIDQIGDLLWVGHQLLEEPTLVTYVSSRRVAGYLLVLVRDEMAAGHLTSVNWSRIRTAIADISPFDEEARGMQGDARLGIGAVCDDLCGSDPAAALEAVGIPYNRFDETWWYLSWILAPVRYADAAAYWRETNRFYGDQTAVQTSFPCCGDGPGRWRIIPHFLMYPGEYWKRAREDTRFLDLVRTALAIADGEEPVAVDGIHIDVVSDGTKEITADLPELIYFSDALKERLAPWRISEEE